MNQSAGQIFLIPVRLNSKISHFFAAGNCGLALSTFISFFFVKRCSRSPPQTRARVLPPAAAPPQCKTALFLEEPVVDGGLLKRVLSGFLCSPSKHSEFLKRNKTQAAFRRAGTKKKGPKSVNGFCALGLCGSSRIGSHCGSSLARSEHWSWRLFCFQFLVGWQCRVSGVDSRRRASERGRGSTGRWFPPQTSPEIPNKKRKKRRAGSSARPVRRGAGVRHVGRSVKAS